MVVVIIIGLLAAVIVPQVVNKVDEARVTKAKADIQALETALTEYRLDNSVYPSTDDGLQSLMPAAERPGGHALARPVHSAALQRPVGPRIPVRVPGYARTAL